MLPTVHYNMGGIPTNYWGEVLNADGTATRTRIVPGLMAVGEAACASVHGANRLGSNSLIDLVVFGRAAAIRCAEIDRAAAPATPICRRDAGEARGRALRPAAQRQRRHADGGARDGDAADDAGRRGGVPHRRDRWMKAERKIDEIWAELQDIRVTDRSMIWNSDLVETLELDNLIAQAAVTIARRRPARRAAARMRARTFRARRRRTG